MAQCPDWSPLRLGANSVRVGEASVCHWDDCQFRIIRMGLVRNATGLYLFVPTPCRLGSQFELPGAPERLLLLSLDTDY